MPDVAPSVLPDAGPVTTEAPPVFDEQSASVRTQDAQNPQDPQEKPDPILDELPYWDVPHALDSREYLWGWLGPLGVMLLAFMSRVWRLGEIKTLIFDETYYVKDAYGLLMRGYEVQWPKEIDAKFITGEAGLPTEASFIVHPQFGKWMIAAGIKLFGDNPFGWRIAVCVAGALCVFLIGRIAWHMFGSAAVATVASTFLAVDGVQIVESRVAILDILVELWVLVAILFFLKDQAVTRPRLLQRLQQHLPSEVQSADSGTNIPNDVSMPALTPSSKKGLSSRFAFLGPSAGPRWWLLAAGIAFGLAASVKWSGFYALAVFGLFVFFRELSARRGQLKAWFMAGVLRGGVPAFFWLVPPAFATYIVAWASWFNSPTAWGRTNPEGGIFAAVKDLWTYHVKMWQFHVGVTSEHPYMANPWGWLLQLRPTSFFWEDNQSGCGLESERCVQAITSVGNPLLWWLGVGALIVVLWGALWQRDWRAGVIVAGYVAMWVPWLGYAERTIFTFYTVVISPFVVLAMVYVVALLWAKHHGHKELSWVTLAGLTPRALPALPWAKWVGLGIVLIIVSCGIYFYPVWVALPIPHEQWNLRMWLPSWV